MVTTEHRTNWSQQNNGGEIHIFDGVNLHSIKDEGKKSSLNWPPNLQWKMTVVWFYTEIILHCRTISAIHAFLWCCLTKLIGSAGAAHQRATVSQGWKSLHDVNSGAKSLNLEHIWLWCLLWVFFQPSIQPLILFRMMKFEQYKQLHKYHMNANSNLHWFLHLFDNWGPIPAQGLADGH